jgi:hypothetical protein
MDKQRFELKNQEYHPAMGERICVFDNQTQEWVDGLPGVQFRWQYEPLVKLLNELSSMSTHVATETKTP